MPQPLTGDDPQLKQIRQRCLELAQGRDDSLEATIKRAQAYLEFWVYGVHKQ